MGENKREHKTKEGEKQKDTLNKGKGKRGKHEQDGQDVKICKRENMELRGKSEKCDTRGAAHARACSSRL